MVGITSIEVKESLDDLTEQLRQTKTPTAKERFLVPLPRLLENIETLCKPSYRSTKRVE